MVASWKQTITQIAETDQVKASVVNKPINDLAERTDYLRSIQNDDYSSEFTYVKTVAVSTATVAGTLVYWNSTTNMFTPALAQWNDTLLNSDGTLKPAESAAVIGILVTKLTSNTGSLVLNGYLRDFANLANLFGTATPTAGTYYLSGSVAGQVTQTTPALAIQTVTYDGNGNVWLPTVRYEHSTHDHKKYTLDDSLWIAASVGNFPDMDIPAGADFGYDLTNASTAVKEIFTLYPGIAAYTYVLTAANIPETLIVINEDNVWWLDTTAPADDVYMWLTAPNSHGPNIVRAIQSTTTDVLDVTLVNGLATVDKKDFVATGAVAGYNVVKDITNANAKSRGFVVEQVIAGEGLSLVSSSATVAGQGIIELALTDFSSKYMDAQLLNLNNALEYTVDGAIYTAFPASRESSMMGVATASKWTATAAKKVAVWLWMRGPDGGTALPTISVEVLIYPSPTTTPQTVPTVPTTYTMTYVGATVHTKYYLMEAAVSDRISITSEDQVQYKISLDNATAYDYLVVRQGIIIYDA